MTTESEIDAAFSHLAEWQASALLVDTDASMFSQRAQLLGLAKRHAISTIFDRRERGGFTAEGSSAHLADSDVLVRN